MTKKISIANGNPALIRQVALDYMRQTSYIMPMNSGPHGVIDCIEQSYGPFSRFMPGSSTSPQRTHQITYLNSVLGAKHDRLLVGQPAYRTFQVDHRRKEWFVLPALIILAGKSGDPTIAYKEVVSRLIASNFPSSSNQMRAKNKKNAVHQLINLLNTGTLQIAQELLDEYAGMRLF